jgi:hypothetical protein
MPSVASKPFLMLNVVLLSVTNKPFLLSVIMLSVIMLSVVMLNVVAPQNNYFSNKNHNNTKSNTRTKLTVLTVFAQLHPML